MTVYAVSSRWMLFPQYLGQNPYWLCQSMG
jgi:hypothetical protein